MISILGCGWFGLALGKILAQKGYQVKGSTTSDERVALLGQAGIKPYLVRIDEQHAVFAQDFFKTDTLVVAIPPKLRSGQAAAYIPKVEQIINAAVNHEVKHLIYISSTGVYPDSNEILDERVIPQPNSDSGKALWAAEELLRNETALNTTIIRFGGLIGPGRHPGRFFAGKTNLLNGQAPVNLIHLHDCVNITLSILEQEAFGHTFNACTPSHPQKQNFYIAAAIDAGLPLPHFIDELSSWKTVNSINLAAVLNYQFVVTDLEASFTDNNY